MTGRRNPNEPEQQWLFRSRRTAIAWAMVGALIALATFIAFALLVLYIGRNL